MGFREFISDNRVCVVTNTTGLPGGVYMMSMQTYAGEVPVHNMMVIPGFDGGRRLYGRRCFERMLAALLGVGYYDYALYLDDDVFVTDLDALAREFGRFIEGGYCLAGVPDGGVLCHRNGSRVFVNTFCSFWNLKAMRERGGWAALKPVIDRYQALSEELEGILDADSSVAVADAVSWRKAHYPEGVGFAETVRLNKDNKVAPVQVPYSSHGYERGDEFEPYYRVENAAVCLTRKPIMYLDGEDYHYGGLDDGCASALLSDGKPYLFHAWYSRLYTKFQNGGSDESRRQTERINDLYHRVTRK